MWTGYVPVGVVFGTAYQPEECERARDTDGIQFEIGRGVECRRSTQFCTELMLPFGVSDRATRSYAKVRWKAGISTLGPWLSFAWQTRRLTFPVSSLRPDRTGERNYPVRRSFAEFLPDISGSPRSK
jgi:hypothetical protein